MDAAGPQAKWDLRAHRSSGNLGLEHGGARQEVVGPVPAGNSEVGRESEAAGRFIELWISRQVCVERACMK